MWNNRILIAATYLDPFKKEFEFFNNLSGKMSISQKPKILLKPDLLS